MLQHYRFNSIKVVKYFFINLFLLGACPLVVQGQLRDNIYLKNETSVGNVEIVDVSSKKVKFRNQQGKEFDFNAKEILMTFNGNGRYLVFPSNPQQVKEFFAESEEVAGADLIVTLSRTIIPCQIKLENSQEVDYYDLNTNVDQNKIKTQDLAAIIYQNGDHKLFTSPSRASGILVNLKEEVQKTRMANYNSSGKSEINAFSASSENKTEAGTAEASAKPVSLNESKRKPAPPEIDHELYSRKALQKTADLGTYLSIISDRNSGMGEAAKAVDLAVKLFVNEDAEIEVSSKEGRDRYKVRAYLNRLKLLKYDRIEISWTDISYVSDLKKGVDGNYYGIITLQQRFNGFMDNKLVYSDLTEKNVEVKVISYEKEVNGAKQEMWDVFLSDIGVVVTNFD